MRDYLREPPLHPRPRGVCPECRRMVALRPNGRLWPHYRPSGRYCTGTGQSPRAQP